MIGGVVLLLKFASCTSAGICTGLRVETDKRKQWERGWWVRCVPVFTLQYERQNVVKTKPSSCKQQS